MSKSVVNVNTLRHFRDIFFRPIPVQGMGSGTIISSDGYILTNAHVIHGADRLGVTLPDGRFVEGKLVGVCPSIDAAVIKVGAKGLQPVEFGNSEELKVGQPVYAIGNPFGLQGGPTVTAGVISARGRAIRAETGILDDLIQTDASINPGNSGGPLIDENGKAIAICTAIIPFAQGIGFAIPINWISRCSSDIIKHGKAMIPWLGISGVSLNKAISVQYMLSEETGVLVVGVAETSPADRAGIEEGDVILDFDDKPIKTVEGLRKIVWAGKVGDKTKMTISRNGKKIDVTVRLTQIE